ncbi:MAG: acyl-CoA dehydrogenase family protein [Gammaproteobacteria bacterium]|nr:acyl-CoA dehydrogenase family protein [Gammaproteobacteria bacterium]
MELNFTEQERAFRAEARRFFRDEIPRSIRDKTLEGRDLSREDLVTAHRLMNARGWAVPQWPVEWGGRDWSAVQTYLYHDEMEQAGVPPPLPFNVTMVGPVIAAFGNDAQKRRFLPAIANLDLWFCQGFSEPGSGSDLASLATVARRDGGHYVVNGQKTWTSLAQYADWIFCLVRTSAAARKQEGISFLLIDMKSPGITWRPIQTIDGGREINEVFFDDVRVPAENLVGAENKGWDYAKYLLSNERTSIARIGVSKERIRRIKRLAAFERAGGVPLSEDPRLREKIAAVEVELKALELTLLRAVASERHGSRAGPDPFSSILKIKGSEIQQATTELLMDVVGPYCMPADPAIGPGYAAAAAPTYFNWRKLSIYGGSNEIQRNIIAKAILGL